ncbi:MAG: hypothetical protein HQK51_06225 [Oligoflexia bacterium]|nr:hypothetical protein [Oligoflexia bacterium]
MEMSLSLPEEKLPMLFDFFQRNIRSDHILNDNIFLRWQYREMPSKVISNDYCFASAVENNKIVAIVGYVPTALLINSREVLDEIPGAWVTIWWVDQLYRGYGLGVRLMNKFQKNFRLGFSVGARHDAATIYGRMKNFKLLDAIHRYIYFIDNTAIPLFKNSRQISIPNKKNYRPNNCYKLELSEKLPLTIDYIDLLKQNMSENSFIVKTDYEFLKWRFENHPTFKYEYLSVINEDKIEALIIFRIDKIQDRDDKIIFISELIGNINLAIEYGLPSIINYGISKKVILIDLMSYKQLPALILEAIGFFSLANYQKYDVYPLAISYHPLQWSYLPVGIIFGDLQNIFQQSINYSWEISASYGRLDGPASISSEES